MSSTAVYSQTLLYIQSASVETLIPNVTNIGGPNWEKVEVDCTSMEDTSKVYKAANLSDPGTLTFGMQFVPNNGVHQYIRNQAANQGTTTDYFKIKFNDGTNWRFSGSLLSLSLTADDPSEGILTSEVSIRLSGAVNFASGSL
jgi:hypothetical protein